MATDTPRPDLPDFSALLVAAVNEPGQLHTAYSRFHHYSIGNQLLALMQCAAREIPPGPLATFPRWKELGRYVRKGEKAIVLCQPVTVKKKTDDQDADPEVFTRFIYRPAWFTLAQTDGAEYQPEPLPTWNKAAALEQLEVAEIPFEHTDGNCQGYARGRAIAVSPIAALPWKTTFHELAHVMLGHTAEQEHNDGEHTPRNLREAEAEAVALICCEALQLPGSDFARGYIQAWLHGETIPERSAQKIFKVADQILKAGTIEQESTQHGPESTHEPEQAPTVHGVREQGNPA